MANALNTLPNVTIQGEVIPALFNHALAFLAEADAAPKIKPQWEKMWRARRAEMMFSFWENLQKYNVIDVFHSVEYYGYKTPGHENLWKFYENFFYGRSPIYVYCIRNFSDHYRSCVTRWPNRQISKVAQNYLDSLNTFSEMRQNVGERAQPFVLDELVAGGRGYLKRFFSRLPFGATPRQISNIDPAERSNSAEAHRKTLVTLTDKDQEFIARNEELERQFHALVRSQYDHC